MYISTHYVHTHTYFTHTHIRTYTHTQQFLLAHIHKCTYIHLYLHTHTGTHTYTGAHIWTNTHASKYINNLRMHTRNRFFYPLPNSRAAGPLSDMEREVRNWFPLLQLAKHI